MAKLGGLEILEQKELTSLPQRAASAWCVMSGLTGASYRVMAYVGTQIVRGVNHVFIAEQTIATATMDRHIVLVTVNEFDGVYSLVSIERLL